MLPSQSSYSNSNTTGRQPILTLTLLLQYLGNKSKFQNFIEKFGFVVVIYQQSLCGFNGVSNLARNLQTSVPRNDVVFCLDFGL